MKILPFPEDTRVTPLMMFVLSISVILLLVYFDLYVKLTDSVTLKYTFFSIRNNKNLEFA